jgi:hypothetical protein
MREDSNAEFFLRTQGLQGKTGIANRKGSERAIRSMTKPEEKPKGSAQDERNRKKTAGFWHSDERHGDETDHDNKANGMACELAAAIRSKRHDADLRRAQFSRASFSP